MWNAGSMNWYNQKAQLWVKVVYVLDRYGGEERSLSKHALKGRMSEIFPRQTPCMNALVQNIKPTFGSIVRLDKITTKIHTITLINFDILDEHREIFQRWDNKKSNTPFRGVLSPEIKTV